MAFLLGWREVRVEDPAIEDAMVKLGMSGLEREAELTSQRNRYQSSYAPSVLRFRRVRETQHRLALVRW